LLLRSKRRRGRGSCLDPQEVVGLAMLLQSTAWCIPHPQGSCADLHSGIRAIARNTHSGNSSRNNSSSIVLLLHRHSRLPPAAFRASIAERWGTSPMNTASPRKAIHHKLWHPWSINRGVSRGALHHRLTEPTTPTWVRSPREKKFDPQRTSYNHLV
jgi:hypothetical protein